MPRDFREALAADRCWDAATQRVFEERGEPVVDCILQNREELVGLCELIAREGVRSYLEIGIWTGRLVGALDRIFGFERVAACDHGWAERLGLRIALPPHARFFAGDSDSDAFRAFRAELGHVDLVFIDANHSYRAVRRDFEINRAFPHRFIALHDITGATRHTTGVARFWRELEGHKLEIVRPHVELGSPRSTMGIGVWSEHPFSLARPPTPH
jgi:hypothetical protein